MATLHHDHYDHAHSSSPSFVPSPSPNRALRQYQTVRQYFLYRDCYDPLALNRNFNFHFHIPFNLTSTNAKVKNMLKTNDFEKKITNLVKPV